MSYENHAWRHRPKAQGGTDPIESGGPQPWIRLVLEGGSGSDQTIGTPGNSSVRFNTVKDDHAGSTFGTASVGGGTNNAVTILEDGIYAVTFRIQLNQINTNVGFATEINGIDYDTNLYYEKFQPPILTGYSAHDSYVFRSGPDYGAEPPEVFVVVRNPSTADADLIIDASFATGTYMEIIRLADSFAGDPDA